MALAAPHKLRADSVSVVSTASRLNAERLMTFSTSVVAVCCASDSCVSLNIRAFSMAIIAWSRKDRPVRSPSAKTVGATAYQRKQTDAHCVPQQRQIKARVDA